MTEPEGRPGVARRAQKPQLALVVIEAGAREIGLYLEGVAAANNSALVLDPGSVFFLFGDGTYVYQNNQSRVVGGAKVDINRILLVNNDGFNTADYRIVFFGA